MRASERQRARRSICGVVVYCVAAIAASTASAGSGEEENDFIRVRAKLPWEDASMGGYAPLFVELYNKTPETYIARVEVQVAVGFREFEVVRKVELAGGEVRRLELPLYSDPSTSHLEYSLSVHLPRRPGLNIWGLGAVHTSSPAPPKAIVIFAPDFVPVDDYFSDASVRSAMFGVASATFADIPRSYENLTGLRGVIVDASRGLPAAEAARALAAYGRSGGAISIYGIEPSKLRTAWPDFGAWMEERFRDTSRESSKAQGEIYSIARGSLLVSSKAFGPPSRSTTVDPISSAGWRIRAIDGIIERGVSTIPRSTDEPVVLLSEVSHRELPYGLFALLLVFFAFLMGPVAFFLVKKSGNPVRLLFVIPGIAIGSSVLMVLLGLIAQGTGVERMMLSVAYLDQRQHTVTSVAAWSFHASLIRSKGLRPGVGTMVIPRYEVPGAYDWYADRQRRGYQWGEDENGPLLSGDFLPSRETTRHLVITDRPSRLRLEVEETDHGVRVTNQLGVRIDQMQLCDSQGGSFSIDAPLPIAESRELTRQSPEKHAEATRRFTDASSGVREFIPVNLPVGTYRVATPRAAVSDDCGVEFIDEPGAHVLIGIYDPSGEGS